MPAPNSDETQPSCGRGGALRERIRGRWEDVHRGAIEPPLGHPADDAAKRSTVLGLTGPTPAPPAAPSYAAPHARRRYPQVRELVAALEQMNECLRRLTNLTEALYRRAATGQPLTADEAASARQELDATRAGIEPMDELLMIRRQDLRLI
jgi:hypothetical protein